MCWISLPSWTELEQKPSNGLILCWGRHQAFYLNATYQVFNVKATSREYFSYVRSSIPNVLFVLVWGFQFEGLLQLQMPPWHAQEMWNSSLSTTFNTVYECHHHKGQRQALDSGPGLVSRRWNFSPNQHGAWIAFGATWIIKWCEEWRQLFFLY